jgi:hypothetical protein
MDTAGYRPAIALSFRPTLLVPETRSMSVGAEVREVAERLRTGNASDEPDTSHIFDELMAEHLLFVQVGMNSTGKAGVLKGHQAPRKRSFTKVEYSDVLVKELTPDAALVASVTTYSLPDRSFAPRTLRDWRRVGGKWKVAAVAMLQEPKVEG